MLPHQLDREKTVQKFKTKVCIFWLQKNCPYGDRCLFAHGKDQLRADQGDSHVPGIDPEVNERYKTRLCRFFLNNEPCVHGVRCTYAHSHEEQAHYLKLAKDKGVSIFPPSISSAPASPSASHDHEMMNRSAVPFSAMNRLAATTQMPATAPMTTTTRSPWATPAQGGLLHHPLPSTTTPSLSMTLPTSAAVTKRSLLTPATYSAATTTPTSTSKLDTGKTLLAANPYATLPPKVDAHLSSQHQHHLVLASHHLSTSPPGNSPSQVGSSIDSYTPFKPSHSTQLTANASVFVTGAASALIASEASSLAASTAASLSNTATTNTPLSPPHPPSSSSSTMNFEKYRDPLTGNIAVTKMSAGTLALYLNSAYVYNQNKDDHHGEEGESTLSGPTPTQIPPGLGIVEETLAQALQAEELAGRRHLADLARKGLSSIHQNLSSIPPHVPPPPPVITHLPQLPPESTWSQNQFKQQEIATAQEANDAVSNAIAQLVSALQLSEASRLASVQHQFPRQSQSLIHPQSQQQQQQNPLDLMAFLNRAKSNIRDQLPLAPMSRLEEVAHEWILGQSIQAPTLTDTQRSFYESGGDDSERSFLTLAASATTVSANSTTATNRSLHLSSSTHLLDNSGSSPPTSASRWAPPPPSQQQHIAMSILGENSSASTSKTCESGSIWRPSAHSSESMIVHRTNAMPLLDLTRILQPQTVELKEDEGEDDEKGILLSLGLSKREDDLDDE